MEIPDNLKYTKEHEWIRVDGHLVTVGITDYAANQLGDVVFLELPAEGETVNKGDTCGVVESVKAVSDLFSPVSGEVTEINDPLKSSPEVVNEDCYGEAWMVKIDVTNLDDLDALLTPEQYQAYLAEELE